MNIEIEESNLRKYIKISGIDTLEYEYKMIVSNRIDHTIQPSARNINTEDVLFYDTTGKLNLKLISERCEFKFKELKKIVVSIFEVIDAISNYLIGAEYISFDSEHIFLDTVTGEIFFIITPNSNGELYRSLESFSEFLLMTTDHDDEAAVDMVYGLYDMVRDKNLCFEQLIKNNCLKEDEEKNSYNNVCSDSTDELIINNSDSSNGNDSIEEAAMFTGRKIKPSSLLLILLFLASVSAGAFLRICNTSLFRRLFSSNVLISLSSVYLSIIIYIPVSDIYQVMANRIRSKRK